MVDHQISLCVLSDCFSISGTVFNWFQSYLSKRTQSFVCASDATDHLPVTCSVPQGSIFGPLGFITYMKTSPLCLISMQTIHTCTQTTHNSMTAAHLLMPSLSKTV